MFDFWFFNFLVVYGVKWDPNCHLFNYSLVSFVDFAHLLANFWDERDDNDFDSDASNC